MLQSMGLQRVRHELSTESTATKLRAIFFFFMEYPSVLNLQKRYQLTESYFLLTVDCVDISLHLPFCYSNLFVYLYVNATLYYCFVISVKVCQSLNRGQLFATPWTAAYQTPLSIKFSRQEYWSGQSFLSPGYLPDTKFKSRSPAFQVDPLLSKPPTKPNVVLLNLLSFIKIFHVLYIL